MSTSSFLLDSESKENYYNKQKNNMNKLAFGKINLAAKYMSREHSNGDWATR